MPLLTHKHKPIKVGNMNILIIVLSSLFAMIGPHIGHVYAAVDRHAVVYIDPHYGGRDNGPVVDKKNKGKEVTLNIAQAIQRELLSNQIKAFLSRDDDIFIPSGDRWFYAKKKGADIYLSLRLRLQDRDCVQIYYAKRQPIRNTSVLTEEVGKIVPHVTGDVITKESLMLADLVSNSLKNNEMSLCSTVNAKKDIVFETADFPAVIIELGLSRETGQRSYVLDPSKINAIAKSIAIAVKEFIEVQHN
jgi:N-acetylmuramoyl-L-alanine amidase